MTCYEGTRAALRTVGEQAPSQVGGSFVVVADVPDHRNVSRVVPVDAARAVLDWALERYPGTPLVLASAARQNTRLAWEAFGYVHLVREYAGLRMVDLNRGPLSFDGVVVHVTRESSAVWGMYNSPPARYYTPEGHVWRRTEQTSPSPSLVVVVRDAFLYS